MKFALLILIVISSCSFKKNNQVVRGHEELYSEPDRPREMNSKSRLKRIVIASTNDIRANYSSSQVEVKDIHNKISSPIEVGGLNIISSYFKILRSVYKNVILLDAGNIFSNADSSEEVQHFYSALKYDGMIMGLSDFSTRIPPRYHSSIDFFQGFAKSSAVPVLFSNLFDLKTGRTVEWPGTQPYLIKEIDGVKVGIIGLITDDIVAKTPVANRIGLYIEGMLASTLKNARLLKSLGADIIVVMAHQGLDCGEEIAQEMKLPLSKVNFEPHFNDACELDSAFGEYLKRLPHNLVDLIIGGRVPNKMANFFNDILLMSSFPDGRSFSYAEFYIDTKTKKIVPDMTVGHQPVFFCREFFKETNDCYSEDPSVDHKERTQATFLGEEIK